MKKLRIIFKLFLIVLIGFSVFSCVPQRKIKYLQAKSKHDTITEYYNPVPEYRLQPGDYLYVKIFTLDDKSNQIFSTISGQIAQQGEINTYLSSYIIDKEGNVTFPIFGTIYATGLSVKEVEKKLSEKVGEIMKEASVVVKRVNFNITLLGEVGSPGRRPVFGERINIFEAIAMGGDLKTFSNRKKVQIIRNENDKNTIVAFDLTKKEILSSPYYYLQPNDIIYVEPLKAKTFGFETFPYGYVFSTISFALFLITYFK